MKKQFLSKCNETKHDVDLLIETQTKLQNQINESAFMLYQTEVRASFLGEYAY